MQAGKAGEFRYRGPRGLYRGPYRWRVLHADPTYNLFGADRPITHCQCIPPRHDIPAGPQTLSDPNHPVDEHVVRRGRHRHDVPAHQRGGAEWFNGDAISITQRRNHAVTVDSRFLGRMTGHQVYGGLECGQLRVRRNAAQRS